MPIGPPGSTLLWPLWNSQEHRLRAAWRLAIQLLLWVFTPALLDVALGGPLARLVGNLLPDFIVIGNRIVLFSLTLAAILATTWFATRFLDRRPLRDLGLQLDDAWWMDLFFGLALGALLMSFIFLAEYALGWVTVQDTFSVDLGDTPFYIGIIAPVVVFVVVGITEELLSRGYQTRNLAEGFNVGGRHPRAALLAAWALSSLLFGMLHVFNPNSTWISTTYLMLAGLFLGLGLILTGRLGLPIGLHITWNFFQGNVYGFPVSGNDFTSATFIAINQRGPVLWTGGAFGPEAGLIGIAAIVLGSLLIALWVRSRYGSLAPAEWYAVYVPLHAPRPDAGPNLSNEAVG